MEYHPLFGPSVPEKGWVPAPRYLLRRARILRWMETMPPGELLEVGCGAGVLLHEFSCRGFSCTALESSLAATEVARYVNGDAAQLHRSAPANWHNRFDYLFAFEVLEHIEDDRGAVNSWCEWLRPGGFLLLSVPAHMSKWSSTDDWAGHCRRYEQVALVTLINNAGFSIERIENYGFPMANMIDPLRSWLHARSIKARQKKGNNDRENNNDLSGIERNAESKLYPVLKSFPGRMLMQLAYFLQSKTVSRDLGNGYLVIAKKIA